jgi:hypothetical protein
LCLNIDVTSKAGHFYYLVYVSAIQARQQDATPAGITACVLTRQLHMEGCACAALQTHHAAAAGHLRGILLQQMQSDAIQASKMRCFALIMPQKLLNLTFWL